MHTGTLHREDNYYNLCTAAGRYVPHGLLMFPPQRINQRVPLFRGRTETETLLASPDSRDWVRISGIKL